MKYFSQSTLLLFVLFFFSCSKTPPLIHLEGFAQGTIYHISFYLKNINEQASIELEVKKELNRLDKSISNYRDDSDIETFNAKITTEPQDVSEEIVKLVQISRSVSTASHGCYDLTIKPLFDLWGFKKDTFNLPDAETLQKTLQLVGMDKLETIENSHLRKLIPNLRIDLSSIGQGYSVGQIANILESHQITNYLVEIGGELKTLGKKPDGSAWRIALEKPLPNERKLEKIVAFNSIQPFSVMTSGTYRHYFDFNGKRYSHILDARSGKPVEHNTVSVIVIHPDPTIADAWSTALLCLGSEEGTKIANINGIAALYIDQQGEELIEKNTAPLENLHEISFENLEKN